MILPDINPLVYAYDADSRFHERAAEWWEACLSGQEVVGIAWPVALGFIRICTNRKSFVHPMPVEDAVGFVEEWLEQPMVRVVQPGQKHAETLFRLLRTEGSGGNLTMDAHLAALAMETGATLHTADTGFLRFQGLKWKNPLE